MATRYNINDFALANPAYAGGTVSFYTVSGGAKTTTLATLYAASTGSTTLANPRTLDSDGKFSVPVYIEVATVATVSGLTVADHDTGIMGLAESAAATSAAAAAVSAAAALVSENNAETAETNAVAAVATIGHRKAATVGGTVNAITATFSPAFASLASAAGIVLAIPVTGANSIAAPTLAIDGLTAKTIVKNSGDPLVAYSIPGIDSVALVVYDASADRFQLLNPNPVLGLEYQAHSASASQAEMEAGTEAALRAVSPLRIAQAIAALPPLVASQAEMEAGTSLTKAAPPGRLQHHPGMAKAWVTFNGTGTPAVIAGYNVASITDNGTGDYTVVFTTAFSSINYCVVGSCSRGATDNNALFQQHYATAPEVGSCRVSTTVNGGTPADMALVFVAFYGDQ